MLNIDFVIYWVDGSDVEWQKKKSYYKNEPFEKNNVRYRDWGILKYWFRAVEQYAPWVHKVYFVADNQRPDWLNFSHPKLKYVDHCDFIPKKYLPTFQANTIENNLHRIDGLSECFVAFNDDMFLNSPVDSSYYFHAGLPCDAPFEHLFLGRGYSMDDGWGINIMDYCNTQVLNAHFNRREVVKKNRKAWYGSYLGLKYGLQSWMIGLFNRAEFQHFYTPHNEKAFLKSVYEEAWMAEPAMLEQSCAKFRDNVQLSNYFFRYWQLASNKFFPKNQLKNKCVVQLNKDSLPVVENKMFDTNIKSLCLNDSANCSHEDYLQLKEELNSLFEKKFPQKSSFEN